MDDARLDRYYKSTGFHWKTLVRRLKINLRVRVTKVMSNVDGAPNGVINF